MITEAAIEMTSNGKRRSKLVMIGDYLIRLISDHEGHLVMIIHHDEDPIVFELPNLRAAHNCLDQAVAWVSNYENISPSSKKGELHLRDYTNRIPWYSQER